MTTRDTSIRVSREAYVTFEEYIYQWNLNHQDKAKLTKRTLLDNYATQLRKKKIGEV